MGNQVQKHSVQCFVCYVIGNTHPTADSEGVLVAIRGLLFV